MSVVERMTSFTSSVWAESKKVTWPSREELKDSTTVVIIATIIIMLYLFVIDRILTVLLGLVM